MRRHTLPVDLGVGAVLALVLVVALPGLAIVGLVSILVLVILALSLAVNLLGTRRREAPLRRIGTPRRPPPPGAGGRPRGDGG